MATMSLPMQCLVWALLMVSTLANIYIVEAETEQVIPSMMHLYHV